LERESGGVLARLLAPSHPAAPSQVAELIEEAGHELGMNAVAVCLAEAHQDVLTPLPDARTPDVDGERGQVSWGSTARWPDGHIAPARWPPS
jgi:hypothetical protein